MDLDLDRVHTGGEEVLHGTGGVEGRHLQDLGQAGEGVATHGGGGVGAAAEQQALHQVAVGQKDRHLRRCPQVRSSLRLLQQHHHHVHRKQTVHHLA